MPRLFGSCAWLVEDVGLAGPGGLAGPAGLAADGGPGRGLGGLPGGAMLPPRSAP